MPTGGILALSRDIQDKNNWFNANFNFSVTTLKVKPEMIKVPFIFSVKRIQAVFFYVIVVG